MTDFMATMTDVRKGSKLNQFIFWGSIVALLLASFWWRWRTLNSSSFGYDEGIHLIVGKLWAAGYTPYKEIFVSYPPIFLWSLGITWDLFQTASALQLLMVIYTLTGVLAVIYLGTVYHSRLAGITAGVLLSFAPPYFITSFMVMTETPSVGLAAAAVALAEKYRRGGLWPWALLTGVTLAFGLSLKILPVYAVPLVGLMVLSRHVVWTNWPSFWASLQGPNKPLWRDLGILAGSFLVIFLLPIFFFDWPAFYAQVVGMRLVSREVQVNLFSSNNEIIVDFLFSNAGIMALALYGLVFVIARNFGHYAWLMVWLGLVWASMYLHVPLRGKHLPIFLPILALFAGFAVPHLVTFLKRLKRQQVGLNTVAILATILVVSGLACWDVPHMIAENNGPGDVEDGADEYKHTIAILDQIARPNDCVIADDPVFLHYADRLPPPELAEASNTRIETGFLSLTEIVKAAETHHCHAVAAVTSRFQKSIPGLPEWLSEHYLAHHSRSGIDLYFSKIGADEEYHPLPESRFGDVLQLYGFQAEPGYVALYWQLTAPLPMAYVEVLTVRQPGQPDQADPVYRVTRLPFAGQFEPAAWQVGQRVKDLFRLALPADLPTGPYDLYLSLCVSETEGCLAVNEMPAQTEVYLGQISVKSW